MQTVFLCAKQNWRSPKTFKPLQSRKCTRVGGAKEEVTGTFLEFWLAKEELPPKTKLRDWVGCGGTGPGLAQSKGVWVR